MKSILVIALAMLGATGFAADCVTNARGRTVCANGSTAVAVNPNTNTVTQAQKGAAGTTTVQNSNGSKAAYNSKTGNAAVKQTNQNGVATTQTSNGAEAKTKNGMGAVQGPGGTTCAKGKNKQGCK